MADEFDTGTQGDEGGSQGGQTAPQQPQPTSFDPEAVRALLREEFQRHQTTSPAPQPSPTPRPSQPGGYAPVQPQQPVDPVAQMIAPVVGPALHNVALQAQAAMDAATFYVESDPDISGLKQKYRTDVEAKFQEAFQAGSPVSRNDIFNWLLGGPKRSEYIEWEIARRERRTREASLAEGAGSGSSRATGAGLHKSPEEMTKEEMEAVLARGF